MTRPSSACKIFLTPHPSQPQSSRPSGSGTQRRTRSQRGRSGRPSGGQPGHKGTTLARTESPDHVVDHDPSACSGCGAPLSDADRHCAPVCRQVFDVPEPRPLEVIEHRTHRCLCGACATMTGAVFPDAVTAPVQYDLAKPLEIESLRLALHIT